MITIKEALNRLQQAARRTRHKAARAIHKRLGKRRRARR